MSAVRKHRLHNFTEQVEHRVKCERVALQQVFLKSLLDVVAALHLAHILRNSLAAREILQRQGDALPWGHRPAIDWGGELVLQYQARQLGSSVGLNQEVSNLVQSAVADLALVANNRPVQRAPDFELPAILVRHVYVAVRCVDLADVEPVSQSAALRLLISNALFLQVAVEVEGVRN